MSKQTVRYSPQTVNLANAIHKYLTTTDVWLGDNNISNELGIPVIVEADDLLEESKITVDGGIDFLALADFIEKRVRAST